MKKFLTIITMMFAVICFSCNNKTYEQMTPEEQQQEYVKFQQDSVKQCTQNVRLVKNLMNEAFDRSVNYSRQYKKNLVDLSYNDSIQGWVGVYDYHVSNGNVYSEGQKTFNLFMWYENNGLAKDARTYYTVTEVVPIRQVTN